MLALLTTPVAHPVSLAGKPDTEPMVVNYIMEFNTVKPTPEGGLGSTHVILAFIEPISDSIPGSGDDVWLQDSVLEWQQASAEDRDDLRRSLGTEDKPAQIMASIGGSRARHDARIAKWPDWDPVEMGKRAAQYVLDLELDGIDIDLEGWSHWKAAPEVAKQKWVIDERGPGFMKKLTLAIREKFDEASPGKRLLISHAPQLPDFHKDKTYDGLLADRRVWNAIDFVNVQFYNQFLFPTNEHIFNEDIYPEIAESPTCFKSVINRTVHHAGGWLKFKDVASKLLLGFPCIGGSMMIGDYNHAECNPVAAAEVVTTGVKLGYPLRGVFEWSARPPSVTPEMLTSFNKEVRAALEGNPIKHKTKLRKDGQSADPAVPALPGVPAPADDDNPCKATADTVTNDWCRQTCTPTYCPANLCSEECNQPADAPALLRQQARAKAA